LTAFGQIHKLPPASLAVYQNGRLNLRRYWHTVFPPEPERRGDDELAADLWDRLQEATRARLMADVPVGVFLSGGLDSSAIAAQMIDLRGGAPVKSFSVGYLADDGSSELDQARRV